jgi:hypothetical protein
MGEIVNIPSKIKKNLYFYLTKQGREIRTISKSPRYKKGNTRLFGFDFTFIDSVSFCGQYLDIFKSQNL